MIRDDLEVFVLNLETDTEKRAHMEELCKRYGVNCFFVDAVDGSGLSNNEIGKIYSLEKSLQRIKRALSPGELGCLLSHKNVYRHIVENNISRSLILEDDVDLCDDFTEIIDAIKHFPKEWECIMLGYHQWGTKKRVFDISLWGREKLTNDRTLVRFTALVRGGYGYLISLSGAKKLLGRLEGNPIDRPIDEYIAEHGFLDLYGLKPPCVTISDKYPETESGISQERNRLIDESLQSHGSKHNPPVKSILKKLGLFHPARRIVNAVRAIVRGVIRTWNVIKPL